MMLRIGSKQASGHRSSHKPQATGHKPYPGTYSLGPKACSLQPEACSAACSLQLQKGFTFIELVFVTLLLGLLAVSALPRFEQEWSHLQAERMALSLAQMLRTARALAITQSRPIEWVWQSDTRRVWLGTSEEDGSIEPLSGRFGRAQPVPEPVGIVVTQQDGSLASVSFFPDGTSQPALLRITERDVPRYQIAVDGTTGQVAVKAALH
ncbi:MAG: GspH/FimT family pseudopilin [Candidatus Omnitrophica bacterium]|nr:GspH/FimT family pseudopilin [Candidatus Omnitrophota bacterium]